MTMKKTSTLFIALLLFLANNAHSQNHVGYRSPNPDNRNIGYVMAIQPRFDNVAVDFSEGLASVLERRGQLHTYIETAGNPAFPAQYPNVGPFRNSIANVQAEINAANYIYINKKGERITQQQFPFGSDFSEGYAVVSVDVTGGGHYYRTYIDTEGKMVGKPRFQNANSFSEGYAAVRGSNANWQVLNKRFVATSGYLPYDDIEEFHEGLARVKVGDRYGFIDTTGKLIVPMMDTWCDRRFSEGLCVVKQGDRYGYMDMTGRIVISCRFTLAEPFSCSRAVVSTAGPGESGMITERGVIDHNGNWVVEERVFDGIMSFSEDYAVVAKDGKYGFINVNGKIVIPMIYEKARSFHDDYAAVRVDGKWGFLKLTNVDPKAKLQRQR